MALDVRHGPAGHLGERHLDRLLHLAGEVLEAAAEHEAKAQRRAAIGAEALARGGVAFPTPVRALMRLASRVMTESTYRV